MPPATAAPYQRVKQYLKQGLARGRWAAGALMPSEAELVARFEVSRMTVNRALRELQSEGLVERVQGVGTFARSLDAVSSTLTISDVHEEILSRGHSHEARVHKAREEEASASVAAQLALSPGDRVFHTRIVHLENGVALQCEDRWVNPAEAPDYLQHDFTQVTPTQILFSSTQLWRAVYHIEASRPTRLEARLLGIAADAPCLVVVRRTFSRVGPITAVRLVHPGDRYMLQGEFAP